MFATKQWVAENNYDNANEVSVTELARISNLKSANNVLAVVKFNEEIKEKISGVTLVLDDINDPGI